MAAEKISFKNLEKLRKIKGISVEDLMKKLGRNRLTYYAWQESGSIPSADVIKMHEIFNVSTDLLLDVKPIVIEN